MNIEQRKLELIRRIGWIDDARLQRWIDAIAKSDAEHYEGIAGEYDEHIVRAFTDAGIITAIKTCRSCYGFSLSESKEYTEHLLARRGLR